MRSGRLLIGPLSGGVAGASRGLYLERNRAFTDLALAAEADARSRFNVACGGVPSRSS
jgi:hypothetical protein